MKLSFKLFIGLLVVLLCVIVWQSSFTSQLISDNKVLVDIIDPDQKYAAMMKMKSYESLPVSSFSHIVNEGSGNVTIFKAKQFGLFCDGYRTNDADIRIERDTLFIHGPEKQVSPSKPEVYIFMPNDPKQVIISGPYFKTVTLLGFNGQETQITYKGKGNINSPSKNYYYDREEGLLILQSDMSTININQEGGALNLQPFSNDSTKGIDVYMNASTINGRITYNNSARDNKAFVKSLSGNIQLCNSNFNIQIGDEIQLKKLEVKGSLAEGDDNSIIRYKQSDKAISEVKCDSLFLSLNSNSKEKVTLHLTNLKCLFEDINCSENIEIKRTFDENFVQ